MQQDKQKKRNEKEIVFVFALCEIEYFDSDCIAA